MRKFIVFSVGLLMSVLGSAFTGLAMGVWVFLYTGSATQYSLTLLVSLLPGVLFAPIAGALVDRWNRRIILIVSEVASAVTVLGLALLFESGALRPWHIFIAVAVQSVVRSVQLPALSSVVVMLAPKEQVARANGVVMLSQALGNTVGFAAGGVLILAIGFAGVLLIDFATFVVNVVILLFVKIPGPPRTEAGSAAGGGLLAEIRAGWRILGTRRALVALLVFSAALNVSLGYADAMLTPLVLSFASAAALGVVVASMGLGAVLGSLSLAAWGGPRRRINGLAGFALPLGLFLCLGALRPSIPLIAVAALGFTFCFTIVDGTSRNILQIEVEPDAQGRVFATYNMVGGAVLASSYLLAGPIADHFFEPLLLVNGRLAESVGSVIGTGPGRGMALLMLVIGLTMLLTAVAAYRQPNLRSLPDIPTGKRPAPEPLAVASPVHEVRS
ncbi:MFS transporter [Phytohabitans suffuscus]|uniref:MFS transporter n=1 Tax=Phytohabitans suffuscus TaxID=624315 RepID=A0A6F8YT29_9ACTN|nr:MFS transporter [Phytohabitans suffuscus]BCB89219.1 MFS transporter [Phytohabitans suffuscus]